ncbi:hypothetical protein, partial [Clavibacter michiganensis]|uniref:hypothetical protein n=1 Tax=Clavibacter michiganensis TaxID=28447 RepID=UPI00292D60A0
ELARVTGKSTAQKVGDRCARTVVLCRARKVERFGLTEHGLLANDLLRGGTARLEVGHPLVGGVSSSSGVASDRQVVIEGGEFERHGGSLRLELRLRGLGRRDARLGALEFAPPPLEVALGIAGGFGDGGRRCRGVDDRDEVVGVRLVRVVGLDR